MTQVASNPQGSQGVISSAGFIQGMTGLTYAILMRIMNNLMKIANLYGDQLMQQLSVQNDISKALKDFTIDAGKHEAQAMIKQGSLQIAGGATTIGASLGSAALIGSMGSSAEEEAELQGAKNYRDAAGEEPVNAKLTDAPVKEGPTSERAQQIKDKETFSDGKKAHDPKTRTTESDQRTDEKVIQEDVANTKQYREEMDEKVKVREKKLAERKQKIDRDRANARQIFTPIPQGMGSIFSGAGSIAAANEKQDQAEAQAASQVTQSTLQANEKMTSQEQQDANKYMNQSNEITQEMIAISNANKAATG